MLLTLIAKVASVKETLISFVLKVLVLLLLSPPFFYCSSFPFLLCYIYLVLPKFSSFLSLYSCLSLSFSLPTSNFYVFPNLFLRPCPLLNISTIYFSYFFLLNFIFFLYLVSTLSPSSHLRLVSILPLFLCSTSS